MLLNLTSEARSILSLSIVSSDRAEKEQSKAQWGGEKILSKEKEQRHFHSI